MTKFVTKVQSAMAARKSDEEGASMVEYGLLVALIAVVCIGAVTLVGTNLDLVFDAIGAAL